jgi:hypothetical protein
MANDNEQRHLILVPCSLAKISCYRARLEKRKKESSVITHWCISTTYRNLTATLWRAALLTLVSWEC